MSQRQAELAFIVSVRSELDTLSRQLDQTKRKLGSVDGGFKNTAKVGRVAETAMLAMGAAAAVGVGYAVKTTMDFDKQMSAVAAKSGATKSELAALRDVAMDLGAKTVFSASESAQGMELLAAAGFKTNDVITAMPGLLDAAAASGADFATVTDIAVSTLNGFGLGAKDMQRVADLLAKGANESALEFTDLGNSFKYVGPIARTLGFSIEDVTAALAIMGNQGIKGEQAGTSLRQAFIRLVKPPKQAAEALDKYNIALYDQKGNMKDLPDLLKEFQNKLKGLTDSQKAAAVAALFGTESVSGMLALINTAPADIDKMTNSMDNADGSAGRMADTMTDNLWGATEQFKGAAETAAISVGDAMVPAIREATEWLTELTDGFNEMTPAQQEAVLGNVAWTTGILAATYGLTKAVGIVHTLTGAIGELAASQVAQSLVATTTSLTGVSGLLGVGVAGGALAAAGAMGYMTGEFINQIPAVQEWQQAIADSIATGGAWEEFVLGADGRFFGYNVTAWETVEVTDQAREKMEALGYAFDDTGSVVGEHAGSFAELAANTSAAASATSALMAIGQAYRDDLAGSKNAEIEAKRAVLDLNDARGRASTALTKFGPTSQQYARAVLDVESAELRVESSANRAKAANDKMKESLSAVPMPINGSAQAWVDYYNAIGEAAKAAGIKAMIANGQINSAGNARAATGGYQIPMSADGRVVTSPMITWVGEAGPEVIVPLNNNRRSQALAAVAAQGTGLGGASISIGDVYIDARGATDPAAITRAGYDGVNAAVERARLLTAGGFRQ